MWTCLRRSGEQVGSTRTIATIVDELLAQLDGLRPTGRERARSTASFGVIASVLLVSFGITGGYGAFVAAGSAPNGLIQTSSLDISIDLGATAVGFTEAMGDPALRTSLRPDDVTDDPTDATPDDSFADRVVRVTNDSSIDTSLYVQVDALDDSLVSITDPDGLAVVIWRCLGGAYTQAVATDIPTCSGTEAVFDLNGASTGDAADVELAPIELVSSVAPATALELRVRVSLPHAAPVTAIGDDVTLRVTFTLQPERSAGAV